MHADETRREILWREGEHVVNIYTNGDFVHFDKDDALDCKKQGKPIKNTRLKNGS